MVKLVIKYNGSRFPRTVALRGGNKVNFTQERNVLELEEYDALLLLKANSRLTANTFQFTVSDVISLYKEPEDKVEDIKIKRVKKQKGDKNA